jgi:(E)-4-hydroxy-3-methyl-but-2-enyl pyrophosphate reductase
MPKTILIAEHAGFCHGVKRAVDKTLDANAHYPDQTVYVLGQLIHNPQEIERLAQQGIKTVAHLDDVPAGSVCVVRTHGATPEVFDALAEKGVTLQDATCPDVSLVQNKAIQLAQEGYTVVIVGKADHPEVIGIKAHAEKAVPGAHIVAVQTSAELVPALQQVPRRRVGIVSQTTQLEETFFDMVKTLSKLAKELKVFNTICPATFYRQNAAADLAAKVPVMVVVGGKNSSNTSHLADICREAGAQTVHIETVAELDAFAPLKNTTTVGVTAGASTPEWVVEEVLDYLKCLA